LRGTTLKETLLLNLLCESSRRPDDLPPWERNEPLKKGSRAPCGLVDRLVWPSRRVELLPTRVSDGAVLISEAITAAGECSEGDTPDDMFCYVVSDEKKPARAVRIEQDRAVWRDSAALVELAGDKAHRRPAACRQLAELILAGFVPPQARFRLDVLGLASDQARIKLWREEHLPLPAPLLVSRQRVATLRSAVSLAETLGSKIEHIVLRVLAENALAPNQRRADAKDVDRLRTSLGAMSSYWSGLGHNVGDWLDALGSAEDLDAALVGWKHTLRDTAWKVVVGAAERLGTGSRALQAGAKAEQMLRRVLREVLGNDFELTDGRTVTMTSTTAGAST
jgi:CRISPR type I-E-associated protein CasA/Cse1